MKKFLQKPYWITILLVSIIFLIVWPGKGLFPFGGNSLIWGDMHDQITAFYYHFYDSFWGNASLLVDFTTSGSVNFLGILAYYILSPLSFLVLFFPRDDIYLAVSFIVAFKILLSSLTCLYFIRYYFKRLPNWVGVLLAICYAFSGYSLAMYQITPWMDVMYIFPLLMIGLKKLLDLEKPTWYIVTLTAALVFSFYVSIMTLFFIFLASFIYLLVYKEKEDRKKAILSLGIATVLSVLLAVVIILPSYLQISVSSRMGFDINEILNSRTGPITDKLSFFMFGGIMYLGLFFLVKKWKYHQEFLTWYIPTTLIMLIPCIVEPLNKVLHFGSYAFFPYRFGFIMIFLLIIGACYGFQYCTDRKKVGKENKALSITLIAAIILFLIGITVYMYEDFQMNLRTLTISKNHWLLFYLFFMTLASFGGCFFHWKRGKPISRLSIGGMVIITLTHITCCSFLYLGIDFDQERLTGQYEDLQKLEKTYQEGDYYRVKNMTSSYVMNSGMVMRYHTLDHFTSLTDRTNLRSLKKLGYSSMWVKTFSKGGTLFTDSLLANRYIISKAKIDDEYYQYVDTFGKLEFYQAKLTPSYGYFLTKNDEIMDQDNSFAVQNEIYQDITGTDQDIFQVINEFELENIKKKVTKNGHISYTIKDEDAYNYLIKDIDVEGKKTLYLEILKDLDNTTNAGIYQKFNIYINDNLYMKNALTDYNNGVINLGTFEDEHVNIKIELLADVEVDNLTIGVMDNQLYEEFVQEEKIDTKVDYHENQIRVQVDSEDKQILFLPVAYNEGYQATLNGKEVEVLKVFDNFIGIEVEQGENDITLTFIPPGLKISALVSLVALILTIILIKTGLYQKLLNVKWLQNMTYFIYILLYLLVVGVLYIGCTLIYILSYFIYFHV